MTMPRLMLAMFFALVVLTFCAFQVQAQDVPPPVVVSVDAPTTGVSADAIRSAIAEELRVQAVVGNAPGLSAQTPRISVEINAAHQLVVTYRGADGRTLARTVAAPDDPMAVTATVAFLAGNLARDQAADVMASLQPAVVVVEAQPQPVVVAAPAPAPEPTPLPAAAMPTIDTDTVDYHARHDRFAIRGSLGDGIVVDSRDGPYLDLTAALRWESVWFGASLSTFWSDLYDSWGTDPSVNHTRTTFALSVAYRTYVRMFDVDLFSVELGVGTGVTGYGFTATNRSYSEMSWLIRTHASIVRPIGQHVDLLASLALDTLLGDASAASAFQALSGFLVAGTAGIQVHF